MQRSTLIVALLGACSLSCVHAQEHIFDVKDDIALWRFNTPRPSASVPGSEIAESSPDGHFVAIVTTRGILSTDLAESRLVLFDLHQIANYLHNPSLARPTPRLIASVQSYPHHVETEAYAPILKDLRWSADSKRIFFRKENAQGNNQLCTVGVGDPGFHCFTPPSRSVDQFDVVGDTVIFTAGDPSIHLMDAEESINRDAIDVTGARIQEILFPDEVASHTAALYRIYVLKLGPGRSSIHLVPQYKLLKIPILSSIYPFNASPDGKRLVDLEPVTAVPTSWTRYIPAPGAEHLRFRASNDSRLFRTDNVLRPMQYTLIDLKTGRELPLLGAPNARTLGYTADRNQAAWSPDGDRVVVTNTFLSVPAQGSENLLPCGAAVVELKSLRRDCLYVEDGKRQSAAPRIQGIGFGKQSDEIRILLRSTNGTETIRAYVFQRGEWTQTSSQAVDAQSTKLTGGMQPASVQVFVRQSLNDPPVLRARDRIGHECELWDPNPELRHMRFGQASLYEWKDYTGRPWSGILVKPVDYRSDVRYPLVIQLYNYRPGEFLTDGLEPTAFAARELADAGFVVLQIRKQPDTVADQDAQIHLEGYASAIERLSQEGLVDRTRVGVVGFSLTCWYVVNALIKQPNLFRSATIADGLDNSYMQYMLFAVESYILQRQMDQIRGAPPIGPALERWVAEAPGFNLDRVQTPVRIEAMGPSSVLQEWELYSSLRLQEKPVDLIYFPMGQHIHQVPLERLESQQGDIDWFRFWLKNEEDLDPRKRPQYQRWEAMRSGTEYRANMTQ